MQLNSKTIIKVISFFIFSISVAVGFFNAVYAIPVITLAFALELVLFYKSPGRRILTRIDIVLILLVTTEVLSFIFSVNKVNVYLHLMHFFSFLLYYYYFKLIIWRSGIHIYFQAVGILGYVLSIVTL